MTLSDEYAGVMNALGQTRLEHLRLQTTFKKVFHSQTQDVIKFHFALIKYSDADQTTQQCITYTVKISQIGLVSN